LLEEIVGFDPAEIRSWFDLHGLVIQEWDRVRTDWVNIRASADGTEPALFAVA
jgi:hypothetical protein